jgi:hypothetical protein
MQQGSVCLGVHSYRFDAQLFTGAQDAQGDFTAISDNDFIDQGHNFVL